ncbi:MAG: ABC transporter ATP-binding protein [Candidatus Bathyarchaeia archaeon]
MLKSEKRKNKDVLKISDLKVTFHTYAGDVKALNGVDLSVKKSELLGLVGESGCGKSVTSLSIVGLLPPNAEIISGEVLLDGTNLLTMTKEEMRLTRLQDVAIVFQDPLTYLNPVLTIGSQITEIITVDTKIFLPRLLEHRLHEIAQVQNENGKLDTKLLTEQAQLNSALQAGKLGKNEIKRLARNYTLFILRSVRLPDPEKVFKAYPFELSGGMRQRAMIAMALVRRPKLLLADEISTALDVTVQAQILQLLKELKHEIDTSIILITHDLAVVAEVCDRVAVMYAGDIVEVADVEELFRNPLHPYTRGLLASIPRADAFVEQTLIGGSVPNLIYPPSGCRFHPRCPKVFARCAQAKPNLVEVSPGHLVACFLYGE